jgi:hypothetical protein
LSVVQQELKGETDMMIQKKRKQNCPRGSFGKLLPNQNNRHPQAPHLVGQVEIDSNLFEELVELYDSGKALRLQVAGWKKKSDTTGQTFLTLKMTMPFQPMRQNQFEQDDDSDSDDVFADF